MKKILSLLVLGLGLFLSINVDTAEMQAAQLDATDPTIFKEQALVPNVAEDQSTKLQAILKQTASEGNELFLPKGKYTVTNNIVLFSNAHLIGDASGLSILYNPTGKEVQLMDNSYHDKQNIHLENLAFDGVNVMLKLVQGVVLSHNIFYNPNVTYPVNINASNDVHITGNIFMRDMAHMSPAADSSKVIYVGGYGYNATSMYRYITNVDISDNLFGLKINELDAIKSISRPTVIETINRLQAALEKEKVTLENIQNFVSTGINSYRMLKGMRIMHNFFDQPYDNEEKNGIVVDHITYLRGSQDVTIVANHSRGSQNGPGGGFKFKSGRNITIMNNYLRNTGIIMYDTAEWGLGASVEEQPYSELSNWLVANNIFHFKYWDNMYAIGMEYNHQPDVVAPKVFNGVFIDNHFVHYKNIQNGRRRGLLITSYGKDSQGKNYGFAPENTYVNGNTRDDGADDGILKVEVWTPEDYAKMPNNWESIINPAQYLQYTDEPVPVRNTLAIPKPTTIQQGATVDPYQLVDQINDADEAVPAARIVNPEALNKPGQQKIIVELTYEDRSVVNIQVPVTVEGDKIQ